MRAAHSDFIGIYEGAIEPALCDELIQKFEECATIGLVHAGVTSGGVDKMVKNSVDIDLRAFPFLMPQQLQVAEAVDACYQVYQDTYPAVKNLLAEHRITSLQIQKYAANTVSGFFPFHCESGNLTMAHRITTYVLYLNDVQEGGETEFLYQKLRVKPKQGTVCIFPAGFTHTHRGNPVLSSEAKYILTGWYSFV